MKNRIVKMFAIAALLVGIGVALPANNASASVGYGGADYCGAGSWSYVDNIGNLYVFHSGTTYCAMMYNSYWGQVQARLSLTFTKGSIVRQDIGNYWFYAGPLKQSLSSGQCATVRGSQGTASVPISGESESFTVCNVSY